MVVNDSKADFEKVESKDVDVKEDFSNLNYCCFLYTVGGIIGFQRDGFRFVEVKI